MTAGHVCSPPGSRELLGGGSSLEEVDHCEQVRRMMMVLRRAWGEKRIGIGWRDAGKLRATDAAEQQAGEMFTKSGWRAAGSCWPLDSWLAITKGPVGSGLSNTEHWDRCVKGRRVILIEIINYEVKFKERLDTQLWPWRGFCLFVFHFGDWVLFFSVLWFWDHGFLRVCST